MRILIEDVDAWWNHVQARGVVVGYEVWCSAVEAQLWHMRNFCRHDPSGGFGGLGRTLIWYSGICMHSVAWLGYT